jgi:hypothetical protein
LGNGLGSPSDLIILKGLSFPWEQLIGQNVPPTDLEASPLVQLAISMLAGMVKGIPTMVQLDDQGRLAVSAVIGPGAQVTILGTPTVDIAAGQSVAIDGTPTVQFAPGQNVGITGTITVQFAPGQTVAINGTATVQFAAGQAVAINGTPTVQFAAGQSVQITSGTVNVQTAAGVSVSQQPLIVAGSSVAQIGVLAAGAVSVMAPAPGVGHYLILYRVNVSVMAPVPQSSFHLEDTSSVRIAYFASDLQGPIEIDFHGQQLQNNRGVQIVNDTTSGLWVAASLFYTQV